MESNRNVDMMKNYQNKLKHYSTKIGKREKATLLEKIKFLENLIIMIFQLYIFLKENCKGREESLTKMKIF